MSTADLPGSLQQLVTTVARLHAPLPDGCPWCLEQTHQSLADDLVKESYEVADAIERGQMAAFAGELGDVLLLIVTQAYLAGQASAFSLQDVIEGVNAKVIRRHPHVFGEAQVSTSDEVLRQWDAIKRTERQDDVSILDGVPRALPALMRAEEMQQRAARVGFEWTDIGGVTAKVHEEVDELLATEPGPAQMEEFGDLLFALVNLSRHLGFAAEDALHQANAKFSRRFQYIEAACRARGVRPEDLTLAELDAIWDQAKAEERG
jgi:tetrapyrrole methylase family protein/MazG family protein